MESRRKALGRGLGALISTSRPSPDHEQPKHAEWAAIESIKPSPYQPRQAFPETAIEELAASIKQKGVLQPLLVRQLDNGYQLIAGERRLRAAQRAGLGRVPISVREANDHELLELALVENLQREDLNPLEEARAYKRLGEEFDLKQEEIAQRVGKSRSAVTNSLRLLQLPADVLEQIETGVLSAGHARSILGLDSPDTQAQVARHVAHRRLSVRETEHLVRRKSNPVPDAERQAVESNLARALGTRVRLRPAKGGSGRIEIEYYSPAELNGLVDRLTKAGELLA